MNYLKILYLILFVSTTLVSKTIDINDLSLKAKQEKKQLLLFFNMKYCPYCESMKKGSFNKYGLEDIDKKFIFLDININDDDTILFNDFIGTKRKFAYSFGIHFFPTVYFINSEKKIVFKVKGHRAIERFDKILAYISSKSYQAMSLEEFKVMEDMNN